jgi:hypothetical protein
MIKMPHIKYSNLTGLTLISLAFLIEILLAGSVIAQIEVDISDLYTPNYNIGDKLVVDFNPSTYHNSSTSPTRIGISYTPGDNYYGTLIWRSPPDNTGEAAGRDLSGAQRLTFYGKTRENQMKVKILLGAFNQDTSTAESIIDLNQDWRPYDIDLRGLDLSNIRGGLAVILNSAGSIYLDDIKFVLAP